MRMGLPLQRFVASPASIRADGPENVNNQSADTLVFCFIMVKA